MTGRQRGSRDATMGFVRDVAARLVDSPAGWPLAPLRLLKRMQGGASLAEAQRPITHDARAAAGYRLTPEDTWLAVLDTPTCPVRCLGGRRRPPWDAEALTVACSAIGRGESLVRASRDSQPGLAALERILGPISPTGGMPGAATRPGRSSDDYALDTWPEEMADGYPQMAEGLWVWCK